MIMYVVMPSGAPPHGGGIPGIPAERARSAGGQTAKKKRTYQKDSVMKRTFLSITTLVVSLSVTLSLLIGLAIPA